MKNRWQPNQARTNSTKVKTDNNTASNALVTSMASKTPWFEEPLLWVAFSVALGIVPVVSDSFAKDLRWLLFLAFPAFLAALWAVLRAVDAKKAKNILFAVSCLTVLFITWELYLYLEPSSFTTQQKKDFTAILRTVVGIPDWTVLSCPQADEDACVYAAEFIPLFQRAGWKVEGPIVQRITLGVATRGVVIVIHGPPKVHPQNPDEGVWTEIPVFEQSIKTAFEFIGIHTEMVNDPSLPPNKVGVYFGSAPSNKTRGPA